jgi:amidase
MSIAAGSGLANTSTDAQSPLGPEGAADRPWSNTFQNVAIGTRPRSKVHCVRHHRRRRTSPTDWSTVIENLHEATAHELLHAMDQQRLTSVELTLHCLSRIATDDSQVNAVLALDPTALDQAHTADVERAAGVAGILCGLPVLIKDNIAVAGMPTTAGSFALARSRPSDALLVQRLRAAGAIVLGKTNLSEWANFRSRHSTSGWSAVGGQTRNPHVLDRSPSGSSSGSAVAAALGLAPLTVGTETDGSIVSPAGICGVVGFKPSLGLIPGHGIVPISSQQDVAGPITRTVADAALLFAALSCTPLKALNRNALRGARIGVWTPDNLPDGCGRVLDEAVEALAAAAAITVPVALDNAAHKEVEWLSLLTEFRHELDQYLRSAPDSQAADLAELIAFNLADPAELSLFGQDNLEAALLAPVITDSTYRSQRRHATATARDLIDSVMGSQRLDAILTITNEPAWPIDYRTGDRFLISTTSPAAVAGYPTITVPGGFDGALPVGITLIAADHDDARLLDLAYAFEQVTRTLRPPTLLRSQEPSGD